MSSLGIDPGFLAELPEEMRAEVLENHVRQRHSQTAEAPPPLERTFLESLPEDLRETLVNQERMAERRRNRLARTSASQTADEHPGPEDIDAASFLATLDPALRREVLRDQNAEMLLQFGEDGYTDLPVDEDEEMNDEAHQWLAQAQARPLAHRRLPIGTPAPRAGESTVAKKSKVDGIELVDKSGIATLLRLLFMPQILGGTMFHDTLASICQNRISRHEVLSSLMSLLLDGTSDLENLRSMYFSNILESKKCNCEISVKRDNRYKCNRRSPFNYRGTSSELGCAAMFPNTLVPHMDS